MKTEMSESYVKLVELIVRDWLGKHQGIISSILLDIAEETGPLIAQEVHKNLAASFCIDSHVKRFDYMLKSLEWADSFLGELQTNGIGPNPMETLRRLQKVIEVAVLQARGLPIPTAFQEPLKGEDFPF